MVVCNSITSIMVVYDSIISVMVVCDSITSGMVVCDSITSVMVVYNTVVTHKHVHSFPVLLASVRPEGQIPGSSVVQGDPETPEVTAGRELLLVRCVHESHGIDVRMLREESHDQRSKQQVNKYHLLNLFSYLFNLSILYYFDILISYNFTYSAAICLSIFYLTL